MKKIIEKDFDNLADDYDSFIKNENLIYEFLNDLPKNKKRALDVGCGTGRLTKKLSSLFKEVYGIDLSQKMISIANKMHLENTNFIKMNVENLKFEKDYFDFIISVNTFHHVELNKAISELKRVMKRKGKLIIVDIVSNKKRVIVWICLLKRLGYYLKDFFILGPKKAKINFNFRMRFLNHLKHDIFLTEKEFFEKYSKVLKGCKIQKLDNPFYSVEWTKV